MKHSTSTLALFVGLGAIASSPVAAQTVAANAQFEEIFVTASKRGEMSVQEIPYNISAVSGMTLERAGISDLSDFTRIVPGLSTIDNGPGNKQIVIRGLAASAGTEQVSIYFDEIPAAGIGGTNVQQTDVRLYDVERIEVLRGPQGTLYGAGSQAGTIRYIMNKPKADEFEASIDGSIGTRARSGGERYSINGMVNAPVVKDILAVRAVGYYRKSAGFLDRPALGINGSDKEETYGGRLIAKLNIGDNTTLSASAYYQSLEVDDNPRSLVNKDEKPGFVLEPFKDEVQMYNLTLEHDLGFGTVTATGSLFKRHTFFSFDQSQFTPGQSNRINQPADTENYSAELRFASAFSGPVQVIFGGFYQDRKRNSESFLGFTDDATGGLIPGRAAAFDSFLETSFTNKAIFGELTYDVTDRFSLLGGVRVFELKRDAQSNMVADIFGRPLGYGPVLKSKANDAVYKFQASYRLTDGVLAYATFSQGFREGGENSPALVGNIPPSYEPDFVKNYELGIKSELFDRQLTLNSAFYLMKWDGIQVAAYDDTGAFTYTTNAGTAKLYGIEIEGVARPAAVEGLSVSFSFRYSKQELSEDNPSTRVEGPKAGLKGDPIPGSFPVQGSVSVEQRFPIASFKGFARADVTYTGKAKTQFNTFSPLYREWGDFFLANVRFGIEEDMWSASIFAKNLFNERAPVNWSVQTRPGIPDLVQTTQPREVGIQVSRRF
ncbi:TonB-dependent receptor [Govanella unica]|uniref:TonB-dependent receptor n=1 Tax=Govanella unica TaxID=2975056 RepID=A0A9X3Z8L2_9PROT|nr:TonB-dependent receptor [Govania unica]MDA5195019.1 TonB-dependent receptor [Govania unica]